jgi:hypothetical protein
MNKDYYDATVKMEAAGTNDEFILGWQCGYLCNPEREEQRITEAYEAGYEAAKEGDANAYTKWAA